MRLRELVRRAAKKDPYRELYRQPSDSPQQPELNDDAVKKDAEHVLKETDALNEKLYEFNRTPWNANTYATDDRRYDLKSEDEKTFDDFYQLVDDIDSWVKHPDVSRYHPADIEAKVKALKQLKAKATTALSNAERYTEEHYKKVVSEVKKLPDNEAITSKTLEHLLPSYVPSASRGPAAKELLRRLDHDKHIAWSHFHKGYART